MRFILCIVLFLQAGAAVAERRVALLIGNDAYSDVPTLQKAVADAEAMAEALAGMGFDTLVATDASRRDMNLKIAEFTGLLGPGDTAFIFYAGHGVEIEGENYLLPTDILVPSNASTDFVTAESISLSSLLDRVRATGAKATLAVIDACRNNPFPPTSTGRSIGGTRGLARIAAPEGTFVMFSAGAGQLALDRLNDRDTARNSVFTRTLLPKLQEPGLELRDLIASVRVEVRDLARTENHAQFPAYYDELLGDFFFIEAAAPVTRAVGQSLSLPPDLPALSGMAVGLTTDSVADTVATLREEIKAQGGFVYGVVDHADTARRMGTEIPDAQLILFGDPRLDARAMADNPLAAMLLPLRMLVFQHQGMTIVATDYPEEVFDDLTLRDEDAYLDQMRRLAEQIARSVSN